MASTYDFQNLERELNKLENKFATFINKKDSIVSTAKSLKFDDKKYGKYAVESRVDAITNNGKRELNSVYNFSLNTLNGQIHASKERVKSSARELNNFINELNDSLNGIQLINEYFVQRDYVMVIQYLKSHHLNIADNQKIDEYLKLIKIESMEKQCELFLSSFTGQDAQFFIDYIEECKRVSAKSHMPLAFAKAILYYFKLVELNFSRDKKTAYQYAKIGIGYYLEANDVIKSDCKKSYQSIYEKFVLLYNELSEIAFKDFNYSLVLEYLADSTLIKKDDILNRYYRCQDNTIYSHFKYVVENYERADEPNLKLAINDTISLLKTNHNKEYYSFWLSSIETVNWSIIYIILSKQEEIMNLNEVISSAVLVSDCILETTLPSSYKNILVVNCASHYYNLVLKDKKQIPLLAFLRMSVSLYGLCSKIQSSEIEQIQEKFAAIIYPTIKTNIKYCTGISAEMLNSVNELFLSTAGMLKVKTPQKDLLNSAKTKPISEDTVVTIYTLDEQKQRKKNWIIGGSIAAAVVVAIILTIVLF